MDKATLKRWLKLINYYEPTMSMIFGMGVVLFVAMCMFWYIGKFRQRASSIVESTSEPTPFILPVVTGLPDKQVFHQDGEQYLVDGLPVQYRVAVGDSTWKVALAFYGAGENYVDIEQENRLQPNQALTEGMELVIPDVPTRLQVKQMTSGSETRIVAVTPTPGSSVAGRPASYVVKSGEGLWQIAERFYGNGNAYLRIFEANKDRMSSVDDVEPGMTLRLP